MSNRESVMGDFDDQGLNWGTLELMGGKILIQFTPLGGTGLIRQLGRNDTCLNEVKQLVDDLTIQELKRSVRTILT